MDTKSLIVLVLVVVALVVGFNKVTPASPAVPAAPKVSVATLSSPTQAISATPTANSPQRSSSETSKAGQGASPESATPDTRNDEKDAGGTSQWAKGSWMRIASVSTESNGCRVFPLVDGVGLVCAAESSLCSAGGTVKFTVELVSGAVPVDGKSNRCKDVKISALGDAYEVSATGCSCNDVTMSQPAPTHIPTTWNKNAVALFDFKVRFDTAAPPVCFASIGDWGAPFPDQGAVAKILAKSAKTNFYKFIVSTGDNFYPTGVKSLEDPQWKRAFEDVYNTTELRNVRWYICAGNHDQWGLAPQLQYGNAKSSRWFFPQRWFNTQVPMRDEAHPMDLFILDTYGKDVKKQLNWLDGAMRKQAKGNKGALKVVLNHSPLFSGSMHGLQKPTEVLRGFLKPLLDKHKAHMYLNGDDHTLEIHHSNSTDYFVSGAGGGSGQYTSTKLPQTVFYMPQGVRGFMQHCVGPQSVTTVLIDKDGKELFKHETPFNNV